MTLINNFNLLDFEDLEHAGIQLDYDSWRLLAGLDSIAYYQFIYPKNEIYEFAYYNKDSITQFAPFVISKGAAIPIHVIYVDSRPVYFSWSTNNQPYAFKVTSGYHQIKLRTAFREIILDSMFFEAGKKLIFSLDENSENGKVRINKIDPSLSTYEKNLLYKYILSYRNTFGEQQAYLEQDGGFQLLNAKSRNQRNNFAGPLTGQMTFHLRDSLSTTFDHEPYFEYEFAQALLKMRHIDSNRYPKYLSNYETEKGLTDMALTKDAIDKQWDEYVNLKKHNIGRYKYPTSTGQGAGKLSFQLRKSNRTLDDIPLNILVFKLDDSDFLRVYPGNTSFIHDLQQGYHKLIFFYAGSNYHVEDSVYIQKNGLNYYKFEQPALFSKDSFSLHVSNIIEETIFKKELNHTADENELKQIYNSYQRQFMYTGEGDIVEGFVVDALDKIPIPGVNVLIKGTTYGTVTDLNGYYAIKMPKDYNLLQFSFIGYQVKEVHVGNTNTYAIELDQDFQNLQEIVVVGYGQQSKSMLSSSYSTVNVNSITQGIPVIDGSLSEVLQGQLAGVTISTVNGISKLTIRGNTTEEFNTSPLIIINGSIFMGDISDLDPAIIKNIEILKDLNATAIYGAKAANGVVVIETNPGTGTFKTTDIIPVGIDYDDTFVDAVGQSSSIRKDFSDYAFWQPSLTTDKAGKVSFDVVFPDDVTSWETFYLAMNGQRQSGQTQGLIKSFKPLMAQLAVPRFLTQGDTSLAIGKALNYTPDSVQIDVRFEVNGKEMLNRERFFNDALIDTLPIFASTDSLDLKYFLQTKDGYFDGEQRAIPVFPKGLDAAKGDFYTLDRDTTFQLKFDPSLGAVSLYARADMLDIMEEEINHVIKYKYACNEQLASKIKVLFAKRKIRHNKGEKFNQDKEVESLIRLLKKNQKGNGLWGWWKDSEESIWISLYVLEALTHAEQLGYKIDIDKRKISELLVWEIETSQDFEDKIRILKIFTLLQSPINYRSYILDLEKKETPSLNGLLRINELKQLVGINYNLDTLDYYKKTSLFGNVFYSEENQSTSLLNNDLQNTLLAFNVYQRDSSDNSNLLGTIKNYFLENRKSGNWQNTLESAQIIEALLPDLLAVQSGTKKPRLTLSGDIEKHITEFPFETQFAPKLGIDVSKSSGAPVYFTSYQRYWNNAPEMKEGDFEIFTTFDNKSNSTFAAGQEIKLLANVKVKKDAQYVMINIPIPAGCSYTDKKNNLRNESHREYFNHETTIFCENLPQGEYTFEVELITRYAGTYTINPAKIELMYYPTFNANDKIRTIKIQ